MGWRSKCERAKRLHRPSHKNWECDGLYETFPSFVSSFLSTQSQSQSQPQIIDDRRRRQCDDEAFLPFGQAGRYHECETDGTASHANHRAHPHRPTSTSLHHHCVAHQTVNFYNGGDDGPDAGAPGSTARHAALPLPVRLDARTVSPYEFHHRYEARYLPCVISNIPQGHDIPPPPPPRGHLRFLEPGDDRDGGGGGTDGGGAGTGVGKAVGGAVKDGGEGTAAISSYYDAGQGDTTIHAWEALKRWSLEDLNADEHLRERTFKCGEDDDGNTIRLKLKHFLRYVQENHDDSPLYVFHSDFDEDRIAKRLLLDYRVPTYFNEDLFHLVGEKHRPPYRWFLIGPSRSGTTVHIDPLATSAWNTLIHGTKRWVIFPPNVPKSLVKGRGYIKEGEDDEAIHYFTKILPRIKRAAAKIRRASHTPHTDPAADARFQNFECYEFTQRGGETVYVPGGWWHAVLNLTDTVGVTQNFCSQRNFDGVWRKTRTGRKKMACRWLRRLDVHYPHLAKRARALNCRDGFVMKYGPKEEAGRGENGGSKVDKGVDSNMAVERKSEALFRSTSKEDFTNRDVKRSRVERVVSPSL